MNSVIKTMRRVGELLKLDCGDNGCWFKANGSGGMRTNGGCSCELVAVIERLIAKAAVCKAYLLVCDATTDWEPASVDQLRRKQLSAAIKSLRELESKP